MAWNDTAIISFFYFLKTLSILFNNKFEEFLDVDIIPIFGTAAACCAKPSTRRGVGGCSVILDTGKEIICDQLYDLK